MKRFIQGESRTQCVLLPETLDDYIADTNPVRVVDVFVDELEMAKLGFEGMEPATTGRPGYHPEVLLKTIYTGISTASNPAGGWSMRPNAISNCCG